MEWTNGSYRLTQDKQQMDIEAIHRLLQSTHWAAERTREQVERSLQNSLCLGLFQGENQVGLARVVSDYATFSWLCDVVVRPEHRGQGLATWMVTTLLEHPALVGTQITLVTKDAQGVYRPLGFETHPYEFMRKRREAIS